MSRALANSATKVLKVARGRLNSVPEDVRRGGAALAQATPMQDAMGQQQPAFVMPAAMPQQPQPTDAVSTRKFLNVYETTSGFVRVKVEEVKKGKDRVNDWEKLFH